AAQATPEATSVSLGSTGTGSAVEPSADMAFAHVQKLASDIGVRVSGTPEEHAAAEDIAGQLRSYGYNVEMQAFPADAVIIRSASFTLADGRTITTQPLTMSKPGSVTGNVVYAGLGQPGDFPAAVRGQIALVERGGLLFREKGENAVAAGAAALVVYNNQDE